MIIFDRKDKKDIELQIQERARTQKAILVATEVCRQPAWIPLSQVSDYTEEDNGTYSSIFIPQWLAEEKGLV